MLDAPPSPLLPALFVAVFAILTAAGYLLHFRTLKMQPPTLLPTVPAEERARAALASAEPLADIDVRAYYGCIGAAIRAYLAERFALSATAMSRNEVETAMASARSDPRAAALAAGLLESCDAAQFAGLVPDHAHRAADLADAREIIELTAASASTTIPADSGAQRSPPV